MASSSLGVISEMTTICALPARTARLDEAALSGWIGQAEPGDVLDYHRGFLAIDINATTSRLTDGDRRTLIRIARRALWAAEHGLVHLVQLRGGEGDFHYRMIARPRPRHAASALSAMLAQAA